jgi:hypothetical protein
MLRTLASSQMSSLSVNTSVLKYLALVVTLESFLLLINFVDVRNLNELAMIGG